MPLKGNTSGYFTAGHDWAAISRAPGPDARALDYASPADFARVAGAVAGGGAASRLLSDLATSRRVCASNAYALSLCRQSYREHQQKQCAPAATELFKCHVKMSRAVDELCRAPFAAAAACLDAPGGAPGKCVGELTAFDRCTEEF